MYTLYRSQPDFTMKIQYVWKKEIVPPMLQSILSRKLSKLTLFYVSLIGRAFHRKKSEAHLSFLDHKSYQFKITNEWIDLRYDEAILKPIGEWR